jgi:hypothetical protein
MARKILIMGLPGAGKTTLSKVLAPRLNAVHFNADDVRANINKDLGFAEADRIEHARRMGWLCDQVIKVGGFAIADFICPTMAARQAFLAGGEAFVIWVDRIKAGAFADTNRMFVPPDQFDLRVPPEGSPEYWAEQAIRNCARCLIPNGPRPCLSAATSHFMKGTKPLSQRASSGSAKLA